MKTISFIWNVIRITFYLITLFLLLDNPILYPICAILFAYIECKDKLSISVFHGIIDEVRKEIQSDNS